MKQITNATKPDQKSTREVHSEPADFEDQPGSKKVNSHSDATHEADLRRLTPQQKQYIKQILLGLQREQAEELRKIYSMSLEIDRELRDLFAAVRLKLTKPAGDTP